MFFSIVPLIYPTNLCLMQWFLLYTIADLLPVVPLKK